ncbi:MAG: oligosaccharide flippase family protein [Desulfobacteraceae bacterium]|jgi:O-antigen/teichoic acid export membrane protein
MSTRRLFNNSLFSIISKVTNALIQLVCLPVLLQVFGKGDYGLIVLAMSLNTFITIIQLGLPTGLPKFVAEWLAEGKHKQLHSAIKTVMSFYLIIAVVNFLLLLVISFYGTELFKVNIGQISTLQTLLTITAITSLLSIPATVLDQLLTGAQELGFLSSLEMIRNVFFAGLVVFVYTHPSSISISGFYALQCVLMFVMIPAKLWRWLRYGSITVFVPGWYFKNILPLLKYCLSLMAFSIFIAIADKLNPVILGIRIPSNAGTALTDYQIINYIRTFLLMISSSFMVALIPHISGASAGGNQIIYSKTIEQGTKYIWAVGALLGFGLIMMSKEVLSIYVGPENISLKIWLMIMIGTSLYNLYSTPIASVILSSGKLVPMLFATASGCLVSTILCWFLTPRYGVGAVVLSMAGYNIINLLVTHFWYLPRYFSVKPIHQIVHVMLPPALAGVIMCLMGRFIISKLAYTNDYINVAIGAISGTIVYTSIIMMIYIRPREACELYLRIKKR